VGQADGKDEGGPAGASAEGSGADRTRLREGDAADSNLRDATPEELAAWGKINDREVARSLRELWDKIPLAYRAMVTQYFADITAGEPAEGEEKAEGATPKSEAAPKPEGAKKP
jgi:hypothetical protein